jgi:SAM-dependent methyltransferase
MENLDEGMVFGEVADVYDRVRRPFPVALIDDVLTYSEVADGHRRALEVGAGTGRATIPFAERGVPIVAVEPDPAMAAILARRAAQFRGVDIVRCSFEEFRPAKRFGLLFSAEAWHWTRPATRWSLAADALADGATLALFYNNERIDEPVLRTAMLKAYADYAPTVVIRDDPVTPQQVWRQWPGDELSDTAAFGSLASRHYQLRRTVPKAEYVNLTRTRSHFRTLPPPTRGAIFAALMDVFDDEVPLAVDTTLLLARRLPT